MVVSIRYLGTVVKHDGALGLALDPGAPDPLLVGVAVQQQRRLWMRGRRPRL